MNNSVFFEVAASDGCYVDLLRDVASEVLDNRVLGRTYSFDKYTSAHQEFSKKNSGYLSKDVCGVHFNSIFVDLLSSSSAAVEDFKNARDLLYHWEGRKDGRIASVYAVFFVERNYASRNLEAINLLLLSVSAKRLTEWSMVSLLRASFAAKNYLPAWYTFYEQVKKELEANPRVRKLLAGLDD